MQRQSVKLQTLQDYDPIQAGSYNPSMRHLGSSLDQWHSYVMLTPVKLETNKHTHLKWGDSLRNLLSGKQNYTSITNATISNILQRTITRSALKSVSQMRSALGHTELAAVQFILAHSIDLGEKGHSRMSVVHKMVASGHSTMLSRLLDHSLGGLETTQYSWQPSVVLAIQNQALDRALQYYQSEALTGSVERYFSVADQLTTEVLAHLTHCSSLKPSMISY